MDRASRALIKFTSTWRMIKNVSSADQQATGHARETQADSIGTVQVRGSVSGADQLRRARAKEALTANMKNKATATATSK